MVGEEDVEMWLVGEDVEKENYADVSIFDREDVERGAREPNKTSPLSTDEERALKVFFFFHSLVVIIIVLSR